uniref:Rab11 family-interacting protein 5 isoform X2 n=1 Tax=Pogona vitticeps TaxID=103695 RepID=A0ABM5GKX0_9SAUR
MSLLRVSELRAQEEEGASGASSWLPSHVQVTVVEARGLRAKAGPGGDAFVALQLGRQKHRTAVATQKGGCPRWAEPCTLELPPPPPPLAPAAASRDPEALLLQLTVWQRALVGVDRFLGRAVLPLAALLEGGRAHPDRWYKLHSKPGKKEKDRGEIKVSLQFTRHSLTASMFDLSVKEKPRSPFRRLKDKVKGRQKYDLESASAIVPSSSGALDPDGGDGEEEEDGGFGLAGRKGKAKGGGGFFFRSKLRKSSLSQSNTSLGSDSTVSSAGSLAGLSLPERMSQSPSRHSSLSADPSGKDVLPSPKLTHKRAFSDEVSQISVLPESPSAQSLKPLKEPISRSSLCINGSHIYCEEPSPKPSFLSSAPPLAPLPPPQSIAPKLEERPLAGQPPAESDLPPWPSSSSSRFPKAPPNDPPRFIPSPPILAAQEEDKLSVKTIALNKHRGRVKMEESLRTESKPVQIAVPVVFSSEVVRVRPHEEAPKGEEEEDEKKKATSGFFRRGSGKDSSRKSSLAEGAETSPRPVVAEAGSSGSWFGRQDSKEPPQKPSSPPGLLPVSDLAARDPSCSEDGGPSPSGQSQTEAAPPGQTDRELPPPPPPPAAQPPSEWDDSFDAFATSRLRPPGSGGGPPVAPLGTRGPSEAGSPEEREGGTRGRGGETAGDELPFGGPELPSLAPEEREAEGNAAPHEPWESTPGETPLPRGVACEEESGPEDSPGAKPAGECWPQEEQAGEDLEGEARSPWKAERRRSSGRMSAVVLGQTLERDGGRPPAPASAAALAASFPPSAVLFQEEGEASRAGGLEPAPPAILSLLRGRSQSASEADRGAPPLAGLRPGGAEAGEVGALGPGPSAPALQATRGAAELPEEVYLEVGREEEEEEEEEEGDAIQGIRGQEGTGEPKAGTPPPKPPRSFTPLSLEEEASPASCDSRPEPWPGPAAPRDLWEVDVPPACPAAAPPLAPRATARGGGGAGGPRSGQGPTEVAAEGRDAAEAQERSRPAVSSGETVPAVGEGPGGAERFEMFPSEPSGEGPCPTDAREDTALLGAQEPGSSLWTPELVRLPDLGSFQTAKELPRQDGGGGGGGTRPPRTPQAPCSSPSMLFWTALEEQQLPTPLDHPATSPPRGRGEEEGQPPALGPGEGASASHAVGEAPPSPSPPYPELLVGQMLKPRHEEGSASELGLSSSWPGERMMDFKTAGFWQAERGGQSSPCDSPALTPGNPFAPWPGPPPPPSPQNNPFVERPPDVLPSGAAVLRGSPAERGPSFGGPQAEAAPHGLFLAHPSEEQPPARAPLRGHPPLAFSTPALQAALCPKDFSFPSPVGCLGAGGGPAGQPSLALAQLGADASAPPVLPAETQQAEEVSCQQTASPHPVKPISSTPRPELEEEEEEERKRRVVSLTPIRSAPQEKLKPSTGGGSVDSSSATLQLEKAETKRDPSALDPSARYYHLTHDELIQLLLKREAELGKRQDRILELESYIDRLLVRIMEHSPTLLQIPLGGEAEANE